MTVLHKILPLCVDHENVQNRLVEIKKNIFYGRRFRRERHAADVEKGDTKESKEVETKELQIRKLPSTDETNSVRSRPSKWGRLLGNYLFSNL